MLINCFRTKVEKSTSKKYRFGEEGWLINTLTIRSTLIFLVNFLTVRMLFNREEI